MWENILLIILFVWVYMTTVFIAALFYKRLDIVDIAWGGVFILIALLSFAMSRQGPLQGLVTCLVSIWGFRLSFYIYRRFRHASIEDPRYADMRKTWKRFPALQAYTRIFCTQGLLALIISAPVIFVNLASKGQIGWVAAAGVAFWVTGFLCESIGDAQLRRHLADPAQKGRLMTTGLWKYSRHPNYFGEAMQWWGIFMLAASLPFGWLTIMGPLVITFLLLFVSGVPLTEKRFEGRPGWNDYKKRTSVFMPMLPKN